MLVLGIETSCDETGASVVKDGRLILSNTVASSLEFHKRYGGVVPEIATRYHVEVIDYVVKDALDSAGVKPSDIGMVAVTKGPGLVGALLVGVSFAKALSYSLGVPLIGVNHLWAHIYSGLIGRPGIKFPFIGLVVSGGHTSLVLCRGIGRFGLLGQTRDDAVGEAFDKVAKSIGLGYPGGPAIEKAAQNGDPDAVKLTPPFLGGGSYDFSFSGLKTAVLYYTKGKSIGSKAVSDIAASFQKVAVGSIVERSMYACRSKGIATLIVGGGVSANKLLRLRLSEAGDENGVEVVFPEMGLSLDNGAMIASAGYLLYKKGPGRSDLGLTAEPGLDI
jgi:N6-L-threonylcarbamoyladenine synthase